LLAGKSVEEVGDAKSYEMLSCLNGALEYYRTVGDAKILKACLNAWQDIVNNRLYITGTSSYREHFHADYDFPNLNNVGETCVTVTWLQFNAQLLRLTGEKRFADQLEHTTLNQLMGAQSCDGGAWGYYVQMEGKKPYSSNLDGHCCLSSGPRGVALIPTFALTTDADGAVVNLYDEGRANLTLRNGEGMSIEVQTKYPGTEDVQMTVTKAPGSKQTVKLRIPPWCNEFSIKVNGKKASTKNSREGYVSLQRRWSDGDKIQLHFKMEPRIVVGDHKNERKFAVLCGPLVLAADADASNISSDALEDFRIAETNPKKLRIVAEETREKFETWTAARAFRIVTDNGPLPVQLVAFADAGSTGANYKVWLPYGTPLPNRNLLLNGLETRSRRQSMGDSVIDNNFQTYASTSIGKPAAQDWFTVLLQKPVVITRVVVGHGRSEHNGGWFDASSGKPRLQIKAAGEDKWKTLCDIKDYPATTATSAAGLIGGERFVCKLEKPVEITGIRVIGKPACGDDSKQAFATCAELQAFSDAE
ncbi:MAG: beta-L-arabinofuranosidase domain-containing protein, partial [Limisphaerales bacterium]